MDGSNFGTRRLRKEMVECKRQRGITKYYSVIMGKTEKRKFFVAMERKRFNLIPLFSFDETQIRQKFTE